MPSSRNDEEENQRILERIEKYNDPEAMTMLGSFYNLGSNGLPEDHPKAVELYQRACNLGCAQAHSFLGSSYQWGTGIEMNKKKAVHHFQVAAMLGDDAARHKLGAWRFRRTKWEH
eukprot:scaffold10237_cov71-Cyclotella_meneghiniana.AAC.2